MTGKELRKRRKGLGMTQHELADEIGVASETVSRWETGSWPINKWVPVAIRGLEAIRAQQP